MSYENFTSLTPVSKTIKNELIPTLYTKQHIEENGIVTEDELRNEYRQNLQDTMDDYYRTYINSRLLCLNSLNIDWNELFEAMKVCDKSKDKTHQKSLKKIQEDIKKTISEFLKDSPDYSDMFKQRFINEMIPAFITHNADYNKEEKQEKLDAAKVFKGFITSLADYFTIREALFAVKSGSVAYRIVEENAVIFYNNIKAFEKILEDAPDEIKTLSQDTNEQYIEKYFTASSYDLFMSQESIDFINNLYSEINLHMNIYCQENKLKSSAYKMKPLYKQILSDAESLFTIPVKFESNAEVYNAVNAFINKVLKENIPGRLKKIAASNYNYDNIYISGKAYETVSLYITGKWDTFREALKTYYDNDESIKGKGKAREAKVIKAVNSDSFKSINEYDNILKLSDAVCKPAKSYISKCLDFVSPVAVLREKPLTGNNEAIAEVKNVLDTFIDIRRWIETFMIDEPEVLDEDFYTEINEIYDTLKDITPLYNRVRNFITKKPYNNEKIKLYFKNPEMGGGWTDPGAKGITILLRDNKYYLLVINAKNKPDAAVLSGHKNPSPSDYKRMVYSLLGDPGKMLPKMFIKSGKWKNEHHPSDYILNGYAEGRHKNSSNTFDLQFCHDLIDYYKDCIDSYPEWTYNFKFKTTDEYNDMNEFFEDVRTQGYKIEWTYISEEAINKMDKEGQIYLFQIYNKDFSKSSHGKKNLHTMFFENIFSEENLKDVVIKLNGAAEIFFRRRSIENPVVHKTNSVIVNKTIQVQDKDGNKQIPIPGDVYMSIYNHYNKGTALSSEAEDWLNSGKVTIHNADKDFVKDKRYTVDKFFLHTSITVNFKATRKSVSDINVLAADYITKEKVNIIGISRGENNLISASVIDSDGKIIEQKSFNLSNNFDYKKKLSDRKNEMDNARVNWTEIGKIKELEEGYLSSVIHEVTSLMLKHNAIIALEDARYAKGSKYMKLDNRVFQKFETMLINKLEYLVSKDIEATQYGGLLKGYQLSHMPDSLSKIGRQDGFIFFIPEAFTSGIDPVTGFMNIFNLKKITNHNARVDFLSKLDSVRFDKETSMFVFSFDYDNFETYIPMPNHKWSVYTYGTRVRKLSQTYEEVNLTDYMTSILESNNINFKDGHNILKDISIKDEALAAGIYEVFKLTVQMKNIIRNEDKEIYIRLISPVPDKDGNFYDSTDYKDASYGLPGDADAAKAYCIAMKGLYMANQIKDNYTESMDNKELKEFLVLDTDTWFNFIQK